MPSTKMNVLPLTLKREFFNQILSGEKTEEFRDATEYWFKRLDAQIDHQTYTHVSFRNGYNPDSPYMVVELKEVCFEEVEWLEDDSDEVIDSAPMYILELGCIVEVKNLTPEMKILLSQNRTGFTSGLVETFRKVKQKRSNQK